MKKRLLAAIMSVMMAFTIVGALGVTQAETVKADDDSEPTQPIVFNLHFIGKIANENVISTTGEEYGLSYSVIIGSVAQDIDTRARAEAESIEGCTSEGASYKYSIYYNEVPVDVNGLAQINTTANMVSSIEVYVIPEGYTVVPIYVGGTSYPYIYMIVPTSGDVVGYIKNNIDILYLGDSITVTGITASGEGYLITYTSESDSAPNAAAQQALQQSIKTSSYASATGEPMTRLEANAGSVAIDGGRDIVPLGASFSSNQVTDGATYDFASSVVSQRIGANTNFAVFQMDLTGRDNVAIHQLDGKVNVTLPIPAGLTPAAGNILVVYRIGDDGTMTKCDTAIADGFLTFATDHFSTFAIVEQKATTTVKSSASTSPKTDESNVDMMLYVVAAIAIAGAAVVSKKRYSNR